MIPRLPVNAFLLQTEAVMSWHCHTNLWILSNFLFVLYTCYKFCPAYYLQNEPKNSDISKHNVVNEKLGSKTTAATTGCFSYNILYERLFIFWHCGVCFIPTTLKLAELWNFLCSYVWLRNNVSNLCMSMSV